MTQVQTIQYRRNRYNMQLYSKALKKRARGTLAVVASGPWPHPSAHRMYDGFRYSVHYGTSFPQHILPPTRTQCSYSLLIHRGHVSAFVMTVVLL